ncbi:MAG TPA: Gfo/Idh/MocA family oxidoreductase [Fimbriimonas sp.]
MKVGLLGAGGIAQTHAKALRRLGAEIDCVCSRTLEGAMAFDSSAAAYDDFERMLDERKIEALYVCLPPDAHHGQVEKAAERGIHLFLEKPVALTTKQAESQVAAIEKAGVVSLVGHHLRFSDPVVRLREMVARGEAGQPTLFQAAWLCNALHSPWWSKVERSGGQLVEQAIHLYDLAYHLFGKPMVVSAHLDNLCHDRIEGYTVEDTSASLIRFENGAIATVSASNCAVPTQWRGTWRAVFGNTTVESDGSKATLWHTGKSAEYFFSTNQQVRSEDVTGSADVYLEQSRHFLAAVRGEIESLTPARQGLEVLHLVLAAVESAKRDGATVRL